MIGLDKVNNIADKAPEISDKSRTALDLLTTGSLAREEITVAASPFVKEYQAGGPHSGKMLLLLVTAAVIQYAL